MPGLFGDAFEGGTIQEITPHFAGESSGTKPNTGERWGIDQPGENATQSEREIRLDPVVMVARRVILFGFFGLEF